MLSWTFAPSGGGRESGINDPGVQTFGGNFYRYLAREMIQNSMDARLDQYKPVHVAFTIEDVSMSDIPDVAKLRSSIRRCQEYWSMQTKTVALLEKALSSLGGTTVRCLRVSDSNTRGVVGGDTERDKDWYNLVRCAGSSTKGGGQGGSFGIGKNAPFAASLPRTVLYSTRTAKHSVAFQGVAQLATHDSSTGDILHPTGFLGLPHAAAVRDPALIPRVFLKENRGTDIWIVGFAESENWQNDLLFSVLESFWPAIHFGDLTVDVGGVPLDNSRLSSLLSKFGTQRDFTAHIYYEAYTNPTVTKVEDLQQLGGCSIYLKSDEALSTKKVAMIRQTGMVIFQRVFRSPLPFAGVFLCRSDEGNARLRDMEPPRHDQWDPDLPEPGYNRRAHETIGQAIRAAIKELNPASESVALSIPGLEKFLPDLESAGNLGAWNGDGRELEGVNGEISPEIHLRPLSKARTVASPLVNVDDVGDDEGGAEGEGQGPGSEGPAEGIGGRRRSREGEGDSPRDGEIGRRPRDPIPVRSRAFLANASLGKYIVSLHPEDSAEKATISAIAIGEDQRFQVRIVKASLLDGTELTTNNGAIEPIQLQKAVPVGIEIFLATPARYALEVIANAAE